MKQKNFDQYKRGLRFGSAVMVVMAITLIFILIWKEYYNEGIVFPFYFKGYWLMGAFYAFFFSGFSYIYGGMRFGYLKNTNVIFSQILAMVCANVCIYLETVLLSVRLVSFVPILILTVIDSCAIVIWTTILNRLFHRMFPPRKILLLYQEYDPMPMLQKMAARKDRYRIQKSINVNMEWEALEKEVLNQSAVLFYDVHSELRNKLMKICYAKGIRVYMTPKISDILVKSAETIHLFDTPLLLSRNLGLSFEQKLLKRVVDICFSSIMLVVTSPVMLLTALAIKLYDGGPVFFRQERCTIHEKVFSIHKFRSMIVDAEKDGEVRPTTDNDDRITPIGRFIRKTRIDELPQLIDILKGDMSLVGPRPERIEHVEKYEAEIPEFSFRHKVKGGLTGYAQIYGKYNTTAYDKLRLDLMYIENYSILLDLKLILMTVKIVFMKESTEGFSEKQDGSQ